ncbi:hypothetical protein [Pontibacter qinzhouensis]|uniref:hypothetical protein n=1 Tax=Pontibacter qinzhouensis TaxID=2603253 RepID=UPI0021025B4F|nr:hypothetical protein [Pontibacter qinzhouensis]
MTRINQLLAFFTLLLLFSCRDENNHPNIPNVPVNEQLNVSSLQYPMLRQDGGYAYINAGYKGIIVVRQTSTIYHAFERACTYDPTADCARVEVDDSNLFMVDKCCGSQFSMYGNVNAGPAILGLKPYRTSLSGSVLYITN